MSLRRAAPPDPVMASDTALGFVSDGNSGTAGEFEQPVRTASVAAIDATRFVVSERIFMVNYQFR
jgi:hypothetical protein